MTFEVTLDADAESVDIVFNNQIVLRAHKDHAGKTVYGKSFSRVDSSVEPLLRDVCHRLLNITED